MAPSRYVEPEIARNLEEFLSLNKFGLFYEHTKIGTDAKMGGLKI